MQIKNVLNSRALEWHRTSDAVGQQCRQFLTYHASLLVKKRRVWTSRHRCSSACLSSLAEKFIFCFIVIVRNKEEKNKTQNKKRCPAFFFFWLPFLFYPQYLSFPPFHLLLSLSVICSFTFFFHICLLHHHSSKQTKKSNETEAERHELASFFLLLFFKKKKKRKRNAAKVPLVALAARKALAAALP